MGFNNRITDLATGLAARVRALTDTVLGADGALLVNSPPADYAGFTQVSCEADDGTVTGERAVYPVESTDDYRMRVGIDTPLGYYAFTGTVFDRSSLIDVVSTATVTQSAGFLNLNAGNSTASGAVARVATWQTYTTTPGAGISVRVRGQFAQPPVASNVCEWGRFIASGTTAPTDGQYFRYSASGELLCVVCYNGTETPVTVTEPDGVDLTSANVSRSYAIDVYSDAVSFWIDDHLVAHIHAPAAQAYIESAVGLPLTFRCYNNAATALAQQMRVSGAGVLAQDINTTRRHDQQQTACGLTTFQWPPNGATVGPLVTHANVAAPTAYTLTNTALPNAAHGVLNGDFLATLSGLTANTDYILNAWQNPAAAAVAGGRILMISGIHFDCEIAGAASGANISTYELLLGIGASGLTLVTVADATGGVKCARRIPLGRLFFAASAPIGTTLNVDAKFDNHIPVNPGEYVHLVLKPITYASTASQTLRYALRTDGAMY
jgi:hypothetical protein